MGLVSRWPAPYINEASFLVVSLKKEKLETNQIPQAIIHLGRDNQ